MVLKLLLIIVFLVQPGLLSACDPSFQPEEIFTLLLEPSFSPGIVLLAANMVLSPGLLLPKTWESVSISGHGVASEFAELDSQLFRMALPIFGSLADKLRDNLAGRIILSTPPVVVRVSRDGLLSGGWQTLVLQVSLPVSGKVVIYQTGGKIEFIDEIDSTLSFSMTSAWPPVLFKHLRIWDRRGMIFSWPEEDLDESKGVIAAQ